MGDSGLSQRQKAIRMALAAADASIQAASAAVRSAHAMLCDEPETSQPKCPKCQSQNLVEAPSMTGTQAVCGDCGESVKGE